MTRTVLAMLTAITMTAASGCGDDSGDMNGDASTDTDGDTDTDTDTDSGTVDSDCPDEYDEGSPIPEMTFSAAAISSRGDFTCALTGEAELSCWGGMPGILYGGPAGNVKYPAGPVMSLDEPIAQIAVGATHVCAVTESGRLSCFGGNWAGQLGVTPDCTMDELCSVVDPVTPEGLESGVASVSAGDSHTCAVMEDGRVLCFGADWYGQTGEPCADDVDYTCQSEAPYEVAGIGGPAVAVVAGNRSTCAIDSAGAVWCWGANVDGILGNPDLPETWFNTTPWPVVGLPSAATGVALGEEHACAVTDEGSLFCWGRCTGGSCGNVVSGTQTSAALVSGTEDVVEVAAGSGWTCFREETGQVVCFKSSSWFYDWQDDSTEQGEPIVVEGVGASAELASGREHACARTDAGRVWCWGERRSGQLGIEPTGTAFPTDGLDVDVAAVTGNLCGILEDGPYVCASTDGGGPVMPLGEATRIRKYIDREMNECYISDVGRLVCAGDNNYSQLGEVDALSAGYTEIEGLPEVVTDVSIGEWSIIALDEEGRVFYMGGPEREIDFEFDPIPIEPPLPPIELTELGTGNVAVFLGACAMQADGEIRCVEHRYDSDVVIAPMEGVPEGTIRVEGDRWIECFLTEDGAVLCRGDNDYGQLGIGFDGGDFDEPQQVIGLESGTVALSSSNWMSCAVDAVGEVWCWGWNPGGGLGDGTLLWTNVPVRVVGIPSAAVDVVIYTNRACALTMCGASFCWGDWVFEDYEDCARLVDGF